MQTNIYKPDDDFIKMTLDNFTWAVLGIFIGVIINNLVVKLFLCLKIKNKLVQNFLHLMMCSIVLAYIHININNYFGWSWQNLTPGLFFISFFFGVQYKLFYNLNDLVYNNLT